MAGATESDVCCDGSGCEAARLGARHCIGHISDQELDEGAKRWQEGEPIEAWGATVDGECLRRLLAALKSTEPADEEMPLEPDRRLSIRPRVNFEFAVFTESADFSGIIFERPAYFNGAWFLGDADFQETEFRDHADFDEVRFGARARFEGTVFGDHAGFGMARFASGGAFDKAEFLNYVDLEAAAVDGDLSLVEATFGLARRLGPFEVGERLDLEHAVFAERVTIVVGAGTLRGSFATFADGVRLLVGRAGLQLDCVDFGRAATLSGPPGSEAEEAVGKPRLMTLHGAQVAQLSISGVDLRDCRFFGAHGLEKMIVEPSCTRRRTPERLRLIDREMIVEELFWRAADEQKQVERFEWGVRTLSRVWRQEAAAAGTWAQTGEAGRELNPGQLAALYRALRKAREDSKDQPGAGDLYYGEMEMRRRAEIPAGRGLFRELAERCVIVGYWLLSGYGLRASRAFAAWLVLVAVAAVALKKWGFAGPVGIRAAALYAAESCSSLIRKPEELGVLTGVGHASEFALRLSGPLLIGLLLLALRARVKR